MPPVTARLSADQSHTIERFESAYNEIDRFLRNRLAKDQFVTFSQLVKEYSKTHRFSQYQDALRVAADLRNFLVHEKVAPFRHAAIPSEETLLSIEEIRDHLLNPKRALTIFRKRVETVNPDMTLTKVLKLVSQRDYSQFPVYSNDTFKGLLTENGITRWLARHVNREISLIELDEVFVKEILPEEEKRTNCRFVAKDVTCDDLRTAYFENEALEAILITDTGKKSESPLGMVTRWDVTHAM